MISFSLVVHSEGFIVFLCDESFVFVMGYELDEMEAIGFDEEYNNV
jgi:hypothetical protein